MCHPALQALLALSPPPLTHQGQRFGHEPGGRRAGSRELRQQGARRGMLWLARCCMAYLGTGWGHVTSGQGAEPRGKRGLLPPQPPQEPGASKSQGWQQCQSSAPSLPATHAPRVKHMRGHARQHALPRGQPALLCDPRTARACVLLSKSPHAG